jgi:tRNA (guanine37-N1)-methyltransferase
MRLQVLTIFPELFEPFVSTSLVGKAVERGLLEVAVRDLRDFARDRHRTVDDAPYGGGGGMVMTAPVWLDAVRALSTEGGAPDRVDRSPWRVLLSPQGKRLDEAGVRALAERGDLLLLCGRYEGIDERVRALVVDEELSIGDYVLSGGELAAMVVIEAVSRQIPGVVQLSESVEKDSFRSGLLDHPHYTRPPEVEGLRVPEVLLSGDHEAIARWRLEAALAATLAKRPELLDVADLGPEARRALDTVKRRAAEAARVAGTPGE